MSHIQVTGGDMPVIVTEIVNNRIDHLYEEVKDMPEVRRFLKGHPRKVRLVENLCKEMKIAEMKMGVRLDLRRITIMCADMTDAFIAAALRHQEETVMSDAEKARRMAAADGLKEAEELLEEHKADIDRPTASHPSKEVSTGKKKTGSTKPKTKRRKSKGASAKVTPSEED